MGICRYVSSGLNMVCLVRLIRSGSQGLGPSTVRFLVLKIVDSRILVSTGLSLRCLHITPHRLHTLVIQMETDCWSGRVLCRPEAQVWGNQLRLHVRNQPGLRRPRRVPTSSVPEQRCDSDMQENGSSPHHQWVHKHVLCRNCLIIDTHTGSYWHDTCRYIHILFWPVSE